MASSRPGRYGPKGYQQITPLTASTALTVPSADVTSALIRAETQNVRWRDDGVAPTATVGQLLPAGQDMWYDGNVSALRFIETSPAASLSVSYYETSAAG